jgi:holo-[acyl-carrier protein] synthase
MYPGIDIIEISRFERACKRQPRLLARLFTPTELDFLKDKDISSYAARFAGKEAVLKALGTGLRGLSWQDIEILADESGQPQVVLSSKAEQLLHAKGGSKITISLAHSKDNAVAIAIMFL